ncbi:unnamed protein product [Diplocarpon coronariae]|nr:hypothetical protein JHW43_009598 [Diplocarpon mali]
MRGRPKRMRVRDAGRSRMESLVLWPACSSVYPASDQGRALCRPFVRLTVFSSIARAEPIFAVSEPTFSPHAGQTQGSDYPIPHNAAAAMSAFVGNLEDRSPRRRASGFSGSAAVSAAVSGRKSWGRRNDPHPRHEGCAAVERWDGTPSNGTPDRCVGRIAKP